MFSTNCWFLCRLIRQKLGCIINLASICPSRDNLTIKSTSAIVAEIKSFLQLNCYQNRGEFRSRMFSFSSSRLCPAPDSATCQLNLWMLRVTIKRLTMINPIYLLILSQTFSLTVQKLFQRASDQLRIMLSFDLSQHKSSILFAV